MASQYLQPKTIRESPSVPMPRDCIREEYLHDQRGRDEMIRRRQQVLERIAIPGGETESRINKA